MKLLSPEPHNIKPIPPGRKSASGDFFPHPNQRDWELPPQAQLLCREKRPSPATTASGRGLWQSADPIKEDGGLNLYAYVGNDPVNGIDPLGLEDVILFYPAQTMPKYSGYRDLVDEAENAGYKVVPNATIVDIKKAWVTSEKGDTIIYHTHGSPSGWIDYRNSENKKRAAPVKWIFDPLEGGGGSLIITSCNPTKVVSPELKKLMKEAGLDVKALTGVPKPNGDVDRKDNFDVLLKFFKMINSIIN